MEAAQAADIYDLIYKNQFQPGTIQKKLEAAAEAPNLKILFHEHPNLHENNQKLSNERKHPPFECEGKLM